MEPFSLIVGSCSLIIATLQYKHQISDVNTYERLAKELADFQGAVYEPNKEERDITELLSLGTMMITQLRSKSQRRLYEVITIIIALFIGFSADITDLTTDTIELVSNWVFGVLSVSAAFFTRIEIFNEDEKKFIKNMNSINDSYYRKFVMPAIRSFNKTCDENNFIKIEEHRYSLMVKKIEKEITNRIGEANKKMQLTAKNDN